MSCNRSISKLMYDHKASAELSTLTHSVWVSHIETKCHSLTHSTTKLTHCTFLASPNHVTSPSAYIAKSMRFNHLVSTNKTKFRPSLKLDGTLSSILTVKLKLAKSEYCHKYDPPLSVLKSAKKATSDYNKAHNSKN